MIHLVANNLVNTLLWIMIGMIGSIMLWALYELQKWLRSDTLIFVNKDGTVDIKSRVIKSSERIAGKIEKGKHTYLIETEGVMNTKLFPYWRKIYMWDEGQSVPRKILYRKDMWFGTETITKILNDTRIKMMTKEPIDPALKMWLVIGAGAAVLSFLISVVNLLITTGVIKK